MEGLTNQLSITRQKQQNPNEGFVRGSFERSFQVFFSIEEMKFVLMKENGLWHENFVTN